MFGWTTKDLTVKIVPSGLIWDSLMKKDSVTSVIMERNVCQCDSPAVPKVVTVAWQDNEGALANDKGNYSWLQGVNVWLVMLLLWRILLILLPSWYLVGKRGIISLRSYCLTSVIIEVVMKGFPPAPLQSVWGFFEVSHHESENMTNTAGWGLILIFLFGCFWFSFGFWFWFFIFFYDLALFISTCFHLFDRMRGLTEYACAGLWACVSGQAWSVDCWYHQASWRLRRSRIRLMRSRDND